MDLIVSVSKSQVDAIERELAGIKNGTVKALTAALNKTARTGTTRVRRRVARFINIKVGLLSKRVRPILANYKKLEAGIALRGINIKLSELSKKGQRPIPGMPYALSAYATPRVLVNKPFAATMKSGHSGWFARRGRARLPIDELRVASPRKFFETAPGAVKEVMGELSADLLKNTLSQVDRLLSRKKVA